MRRCPATVMTLSAQIGQMRHPSEAGDPPSRHKVAFGRLPTNVHNGRFAWAGWKVEAASMPF
jgi:hypothetical protein